MTVNRFIINIFIILLSLISVEAVREKFINITDVNAGEPLITGHNATVKIKFIRDPLEEKEFNFVVSIVNNNKTELVPIYTVKDESYQFEKDNTYSIKFVVPEQLPEGDHKMYAYIGEEKISDSSFPVKVVKSTEPPVQNATPQPSANQNPGSPTPNVNQAEGQKSNSNSPFHTHGIIIAGVVAAGIVIIAAILYIFCVRDSKDKSHDSSVYELQHAVSEPQLISSSSPINAIPLRYPASPFANNPASPFANNPTSPFANNINASFMMSPRGIASPIASPIAHSGSNYSNNYNTDTQALTAKKYKRDSDTLPRDTRDSQLRDTYYSNNSNYISQDSMTSRDEEMPSPTPSYYYQLFKPHQVYRVLYDFKPSLPDEIEVQAGDVIRTEETFEDGWAFGVNMTSGKKGTFPMNCLEDDFAENENKSCVSERSQRSQRSRRTSSLPNNQNIQNLQLMLDNIGDKDDNNNGQNFQKAYYISQANNMKV